MWLNCVIVEVSTEGATSATTTCWIYEKEKSIYFYIKEVWLQSWKINFSISTLFVPVSFSSSSICKCLGTLSPHSVSPVHAKILGYEALLHFTPTILIFFLAKIKYDFEESLTSEIINIYCRQCKFEPQTMVVSPNSN